MRTPSARRFTPLVFFFPPNLSRALRRATASCKGELLTVVHLDVLVDEAPLDRNPAELVQQDRLAHAPQPGHQLALGGATDQHPLQGHVHVADFVGPPRQFERSRTGTGVVRVQYLVHSGNLYLR